MTDSVNHPAHYVAHSSGIECIDLTEYMDFCLGNAFKYVWRHADKGRPEQDLDKALWYIDRSLRQGWRRRDRAPEDAWDALHRVVAYEEDRAMQGAFLHLGTVGLGDSVDPVGHIEQAGLFIAAIASKLVTNGWQ